MGFVRRGAFRVCVGITLMSVGLHGTLQLSGCTKNNASFCETVEDCDDGEACVGNACEARAPGQPDASPPDASPQCPVATHQCIEVAPADWSGPALRADALRGESPPDCPADFTESSSLSFHGLQADGTCGCSCGTANTLTCSGASIQGRDGSPTIQNCLAQCLVGTCPSVSLAPNACTSIPAAVRMESVFKTTRGSVSGGSCQPGTASSNLNPPSFSDQSSLCGASAAALGEGCADGSACTVLPPSAFSPEMCIFRIGDHECPAGSAFSERLLTFDSFSDQRSCDTCDCDIGLGSSCGSVELFSDDDTCVTTGSPAGSCIANPVFLSPRARFIVTPSAHSCTATVDPPVSGAALGTSPTTLCCVPAS